MACNIRMISLPCVGKVVPDLEPVTLNTNLNFRSKSCTKKSSTVANVKTPTPGMFETFGWKFVPEILIAPLEKLEAEFNSILKDHEFKVELAAALRDYVGRETPLYHAQNLTDHYKNINGEGPEVYLKREDLSHGGSYKMSNVIAQAILAKRMGQKSVITATSAGNHGVAAAAVSAKYSLDCTIYIGSSDMQRKPSNVQRMKLLGAQAAVSESTRAWIENLETSYFLASTAVGPHPIPTMVREFYSVIGKETRKQAIEKWGGLPDVLVACVGIGCNALGLFHEFIGDESVRMIGIEGGGVGTSTSELHSATLARGEVGVYHGAICYLLQDEAGQIIRTESVASGLEFPGVSPELSFLKDAGRLECYTVTDQEALDACKRLCHLEGIFLALETSHALAYLEKLCPTLPHGARVVVNCSGTDYNDITSVLKM